MNLNTLAANVHIANAQWWQDVNTGQPIKRNKGELLALIHSEISEALEGERKDLTQYLVNLALLQQGMLRGEALTGFVQTTIGKL